MRALVFIFVFLWVTAMSSWLSVPLSVFLMKDANKYSQKSLYMIK